MLLGTRYIRTYCTVHTYILYSTYCTYCTVHTVHTVLYILYILYSTYCTYCTYRTVPYCVYPRQVIYQPNSLFYPKLEMIPGSIAPFGSSVSPKTRKTAKFKKRRLFRSHGLPEIYEMLRNRSHIKDLANSSCQKLDAHPINISAQAESLKTPARAHV